MPVKRCAGALFSKCAESQPSDSCLVCTLADNLALNGERTGHVDLMTPHVLNLSGTGSTVYARDIVLEWTSSPKACGCRDSARRWPRSFSPVSNDQTASGSCDHQFFRSSDSRWHPPVRKDGHQSSGLFAGFKGSPVTCAFPAPQTPRSPARGGS